MFLDILSIGGFAYVYIAQDIQTNIEYALKRLLGADKDECNNIIREINIHKQVSGYPNIVKFVAASFIDRTQVQNAQKRAEYLLVAELCKNGSLYDCIERPMEPDTVLRVFYQAAKAVQHLHSQNIPITHRDIKVITVAFMIQFMLYILFIIIIYFYFRLKIFLSAPMDY